MSFSVRRAFEKLSLLAIAFVALASCDTAAVTGPGRKPPYLAILLNVDAAPEIQSGGPYTFRVRELSGTIKFDTTFRASVRDTVILSVTAATYRVDISDVPPTCGVRDGTAQAIVVPPNTNTSLIRFSLSCSAALVVAAAVDGFAIDSEFVVTVQDSLGKQVGVVLAANDTIRLDNIAAGRYDVSLRHIADNCVVISDGGLVVPVTIRPSGGAFVPFRVICSEAAKRPRIQLLAGSYDNGTIGYVIRAVDPDKDVDRTFVDVTDCNQRSVLTGGGRRRGGFGGWPNVTGRDTAVIVGSYDLDLPDSVFNNRCLGAWVADSRGNTSVFVEIPLKKSDAAKRPILNPFNARLNGTKSIIVDLTVRDPDNDFVGLFGVYLVRDGVLSIFDGQLDRVVVQPAGVIANTLPEFLVNIGFGIYSDYMGVIIYGFDRAGNFTRMQDLQLAF